MIFRKLYQNYVFDQLLLASRTPQQRASLAATAGIPEDALLELVKLSDLARLPGVKGIRARLYYDAGVDTVDKLAGWEPETLLTLTAEFVEGRLRGCGSPAEGIQLDDCECAGVTEGSGVVK